MNYNTQQKQEIEGIATRVFINATSRVIASGELDGVDAQDMAREAFMAAESFLEQRAIWRAQNEEQ